MMTHSFVISSKKASFSCCCFYFCVVMSGAKKPFDVGALMKGRKTAKGQHEAEMKAMVVKSSS